MARITITSIRGEVKRLTEKQLENFVEDLKKDRGHDYSQNWNITFMCTETCGDKTCPVPKTCEYTNGCDDKVKRKSNVDRVLDEVEAEIERRYDV